MRLPGRCVCGAYTCVCGVCGVWYGHSLDLAHFLFLCVRASLCLSLSYCIFVSLSLFSLSLLPLSIALSPRTGPCSSPVPLDRPQADSVHTELRSQARLRTRLQRGMCCCIFYSLYLLYVEVQKVREGCKASEILNFRPCVYMRVPTQSLHANLS